MPPTPRGGGMNPVIVGSQQLHVGLDVFSILHGQRRLEQDELEEQRVMVEQIVEVLGGVVVEVRGRVLRAPNRRDLERGEVEEVASLVHSTELGDVDQEA